MSLTREDIVVGGLYRAKRPARCSNGEMNDRVVIYIGRLGLDLQYDSYSIPNGRHYPRVDMDKFLRWASHRINEDGTPWSAADQNPKQGIEQR